MKNVNKKKYSEEEEKSDTRLSLDFEIKEKDKLTSSINMNTNNRNNLSLLSKDRAKSARPFLLSRHGPKIRPKESSIIPSYMNLWGKNADDNKLYKTQFGINEEAEEDYEKFCNSGDERYSYKKFYLNNDIILSSSDDNEIIDNKTKENTKEDDKDDNINNINIKIENKKKVLNFKHIRKKIFHIKNRLKLNKYIDDTSIIKTTLYHNYFKENFEYKWKNKNNDNKNNLSDNLIEFEYNLTKRSKSIYLKGSKTIRPILGFLKMNDSSNNINNTLSSGDFSEL